MKIIILHGRKVVPKNINGIYQDDFSRKGKYHSFQLQGLIWKKKPSSNQFASSHRLVFFMTVGFDH